MWQSALRRYADMLMGEAGGGGGAASGQSRPVLNEYFQPEWNPGTAALGADCSAMVSP